MPSTMKFKSHAINSFVNQKMRYIIKEKRWETQEEVLIRLLRIKDNSAIKRGEYFPPL